MHQNSLLIPGSERFSQLLDMFYQKPKIHPTKAVVPAAPAQKPPPTRHDPGFNKVRTAVTPQPTAPPVTPAPTALPIQLARCGSRYCSSELA